MFKFVRIWMALLAGELMLDFTVNTKEFPFHARWHGQRTKVRLDSRRLENGTIFRNLWTEQGTIPHHLNGIELFKIIVALAFKGFVEDFYGGISMRLVEYKGKIHILNAILTRLGYATLSLNEYHALRGVMMMIKNNNDALKQKVASHEQLLNTFGNLTDEVHDVRGRLDETRERLGQTTNRLSDTQKDLSNTQYKLADTQNRVAMLEAKNEAICAALGIRSVDEFLQSVLPNAVGETPELD